MSAHTPVRRLPRPEAGVAAQALSRVALRVDPFDFVPAEGVTARLVTLGPFHLRRAEYRALADAAPSASAVLANLYPEGSVYDGSIWEVSTAAYPFDVLKSDEQWNAIGSSALWDRYGLWAVVVSDEGHGVIAGDSTFVADFETRLPSDARALRDIVERLYVGRDGSQRLDTQLIAMVTRLYGEDQARTALAGVTNAR